MGEVTMIRCFLLLGLSLASPATARAQGRVAELPVPGFREAVTVAPAASGRRPVLIVLHGRGDSPDTICPAFDLLAAGRSWIVCPRGIPFRGGPGWTYPQSRRTVAAEVRAALAALARAHPDRVDVTDPVLAGFSLGAMYASFLAEDAPATFPRALIVDTHYVWTAGRVRRFARRGGRAVVFACTRGYVSDCRRLSPTESPIPTQTRLLPDREHTYDRTLFDRIRPDFTTLIAGDPRYR